MKFDNPNFVTYRKRSRNITLVNLWEKSILYKCSLHTHWVEKVLKIILLIFSRNFIGNANSQILRKNVKLTTLLSYLIKELLCSNGEDVCLSSRKPRFNSPPGQLCNFFLVFEKRPICQAFSSLLVKNSKDGTILY